MSDSTSYIEGIHNWCDRWCEHCKYTDQCYSFQMEKEAGFDPLKEDYSEEELWLYVSQRMSEALELIRKHAKETGIDLDNLPDVEEGPAGEMAIKLKQVSLEIHQSYTELTDSFFENNKTFFEERGHESIKWVEMGISSEVDTLKKWKSISKQAEIIQWYKNFIMAKMQRALKGLDEMNEDYWESPEQSDANRTARIVMVAIERSMSAWRIILDVFPEKENDVIGVLAHLSNFRKLVVNTFPRWFAAGPDVQW